MVGRPFVPEVILTPERRVCEEAASSVAVVVPRETGAVATEWKLIETRRARPQAVERRMALVPVGSKVARRGGDGPWPPNEVVVALDGFADVIEVAGPDDGLLVELIVDDSSEGTHCRELPSCFKCLSRLETSWAAAAVAHPIVARDCKACALLADGGVRCEQCGKGDAWLCLVCGFAGCSRYARRHSFLHFSDEPTHSLTLEVKTSRVWDYTDDAYAHSLPATTTPPRRRPGRRDGDDDHDDGDGDDKEYGDGDESCPTTPTGTEDHPSRGGRPSPLSSSSLERHSDERHKLRRLAARYEAVLTHSLGKQRSDFEDQIDRLTRGDTTTDAPGRQHQHQELALQQQLLLVETRLAAAKTRYTNLADSKAASEATLHALSNLARLERAAASARRAELTRQIIDLESCLKQRAPPTP